MAQRPEPKKADPPGAQFWQPLELLWDEALGDLDEPAVRRGGGGLDRVTIVSAAIAIADADGLDAVSMRRIAQDLGTGAMSLYRHVPDKNTLISLMIEHVLTEREDDVEPETGPDGTAHWRVMMNALAAAAWQTVQRHPWYAEASMVRPQLTPRGVAGLEWALSAFDGYDLKPGEAMTMVGAVYSTVTARALSHVVEMRTRRAAGLVTEADVQRAGADLVRRILSSGEYPRFGRFVIEAEHNAAPEASWRPALDLILDGIEVRLSRQPTVPPGSAAQPKKTSASA